MGLTFAVLFFFALLVVWILLPFLPGLGEVQRKSDAMPLPISHDSEVDIRYPARRFRSYIRIPLTPVLERCRDGHLNEPGVLEDGTEYTALGQDGDLTRVRSLSLRPCNRMLLSARELFVPAGSICQQDVYAAESLESGRECIFRAVLADGPVRLGEGCTTLRWMHSADSIRTASGCRLLGRASADGVMKLASSCRFERLHAPRIEFGNPVAFPENPAKLRVITSNYLTNLVEDQAGRWLFRKELRIGQGKEIRADIVVTGPLEVGAGTRIYGSLKSHGNLTLGKGVIVEGSVISRKNLILGEGCRVHGPVVAEADLTLETGCVIGTPERLTTVSAKRISISPGVVCHGTVRAYEEGMLTGVERAIAQPEERPSVLAPRLPQEKVELIGSMPAIAPVLPSAPVPAVVPAPPVAPVPPMVSESDAAFVAAPIAAPFSRRVRLPGPAPVSSADEPLVLRPETAAPEPGAPPLGPASAEPVPPEPRRASRARLPGATLPDEDPAAAVTIRRTPVSRPDPAGEDADTRGTWRVPPRTRRLPGAAPDNAGNNPGNPGPVSAATRSEAGGE